MCRPNAQLNFRTTLESIGHYFVLKLFAADVTNVGCRSAVFILVVLFQSSGTWEMSVAVFAIGVLGVFLEDVFRQPLLAIELFITVFTSLVCLDVWVVFTFVFVNVENVTIQTSTTVAFCFTVGTLLCVEDAFYPCSQGTAGTVLFKNFSLDTSIYHELNNLSS